MKHALFTPYLPFKVFLLILLFSAYAHAQSGDETQSRYRFGGTIGASFGSDYMDVVVAPSVVYDFNQYFSAGGGLQGSYVRLKDRYESYLYGGSLIGIFSPVEEVQLSVELEELRVNNTFKDIGFGEVKDNFWNTALYLGVGYNTGNVTIGVRYNILFDKDKFVYNEAFMPFVRVYF